MMNERAIETWREKLEFLLAEEAKISSAAQKFEVQQQIAEARRRIAELEADSQQPRGTKARDKSNESSPPMVEVNESLSGEHRFDVFLSHNSKDKPAVRELAKRLADRGLRVWLDEQQLVPGRPWQEALESIIETTRSAAVLVGKDGQGPWQSREMRACLSQFVKRDLPVIPVLLPGASHEPELPLFLTDLTWVDLRGGFSEAGLDALQWGITGIDPRLQPPTPPTPGPLTPERLDELTAYARQSIAAAAQAWLDEQCAPFIVPSLSRRKSEREHHGMFSGREEKEWLSEDEIQALVLGNLPLDANRVRIIGDSGMGKTALLYYCESQAASANGVQLPIRIDALSACNWKSRRSEVLEWMVDRLLHRHLPDDIKQEQALEWFTQRVDRGEVVFLLDALDQTERDWNEVGLRSFLQSSGVTGCPVIISLRPEVAGSPVFSGSDWDSIRAEGFHESDQQRRYLGDLGDVILTTEGESWRDTASFERKQQWADLLTIPLLLRMLRQLARAERDKQPGISLSHLPNRHAVYHRAVDYLVAQGLQALESSPHRGKLYDAGEVDDHLIEIGWLTIAQGDGNFTAVLDGQAFRQLRQRFHDVGILRALQQVDVITRHCLLDGYGDAGLAWRHRSFSEYYAGRHLARSEHSLQHDIARRHARNGQWQWVFRFALSKIAAETSDLDGRLAQSLIQYGNPFVVYDAIERDGIKLPEHLDRLCRWLVHRDWDWGGRDYRQAWQGEEPPAVDSRWVEILEALFEWQYRNSRCLHAAWQLVRDRDEDWAVGIRERFLGEFARMLAVPECSEHATARDLIAEASFVRCPPDPKDDGKPFQMGSPKGDEEAFSDEQPRHEVVVTPFRLRRFAVTNRQFELFDPSHRFRRDGYSEEDDQPAIWVSWYMADLFCTWLGEAFRLPTEAEWEYAARAGKKTKYWWGDDFDKSKCHNFDSGVGHTLPPDTSRANPWGLIDMLGNVWEWCHDGMRSYDGTTQQDPVGPLEQAGVRVSRGGCWAGGARSCRAAIRLAGVPAFRRRDLGFRLAAVPLGGAGSQEG